MVTRERSLSEVNERKINRSNRLWRGCCVRGDEYRIGNDETCRSANEDLRCVDVCP